MAFLSLCCEWMQVNVYRETFFFWVVVFGHINVLCKWEVDMSHYPKYYYYYSVAAAMKSNHRVFILQQYGVIETAK